MGDILGKFSAKLWALLQPLGPWGVLVGAAADGAGVPLPGALDALVATYIYNSPWRHAWMYVLMASVGSAAGSIVPYLIGYEGGEMLLRKRMSPAKFDKVRRSFEEHEFLALMLPAVMPPPFPFKLLVFAAAVFEMRFVRFLAAILVGRIVRYTLLALLTIQFGPHVVTLIGIAVKRHLALILVVIAIALAAWLIMRRRRASGAEAPSD